MEDKGFYKKIKMREEDRVASFINKSNWWKYILLLLLFILFAPAFPRRFVRSYPTTKEEYIQQMIIVSCGIFVVICLFILKPYLNYKRGYNLSGKFIVGRKLWFLGLNIVMLRPGKVHFVRVDRQFYKFIKVGDNVLIQKRALGDLIKIKKI